MKRRRGKFSIIIVAETKAEDPMLKTVALNPLVPETFFPSNFEIELKISSHRLPTHRRGGHRKFFPWSRLSFKMKFRQYVKYFYPRALMG